MSILYHYDQKDLGFAAWDWPQSSARKISSMNAMAALNKLLYSTVPPSDARKMWKFPCSTLICFTFYG